MHKSDIGHTVLVTGGAGFIGSHLVRQLVTDGTHVRVLDDLSTGSKQRIADLNVEFIQGDIRNVDHCKKAVQGVETVFHLAAYVSVPGSMKNPALADSINIDGTRNMLQAARESGVERFVFSSSCAVYGDTKTVPTPEDTLPRPMSIYATEKLRGEELCQMQVAPKQFETVILRYFNVYGPGQNPDSEYAAVIPKFITALLAHTSPTIFGDGQQTRDFLYVDDVVRANLAAATTPNISGEVFNIASGHATSLNQLYDELAHIIGHNLPAQYAPPRHGDIEHSVANVTKASSKLHFTAQTDLKTGLTQTVNYYRHQP